MRILPEGPAAPSAETAPEEDAGPSRPDEPEADRPRAEGEGRMQPDVVEADRLEAVDPDSVGLLGEDQGGFGIEMWAGTSRSLVEKLLPDLPAATTSRAARDLMRRLLLSTATAPAGESAGRSLLAIRVDRLMAMGDLDAVQGLLRVAPSRRDNETLAKAQVDVLWLLNETAEACTHVRRLIREYQDPYWQKSFIFCQALSGENTRAALGTDLLREQGYNEDAAFFLLVERLVGASDEELENLTEPTPLHLAMMRAGRVQMPSDVLVSDDAAILRTIATSPNAELDIRLEAAERAEAVGALPATALTQIYASVVFDSETLANALSEADERPGPTGRALLYRAALMQGMGIARAEVLQKALQSGRENRLYGTVVRTFLPLLADLEPSSELVWFAPDAVRALLYAGRTEDARVWFDLLSREAGSGDSAAAPVAALRPLIGIASEDETALPDPAAVAAWWKAQDADDETAQRRASVLYSVLDGLGVTVDNGLWEPLLTGPRRATVVMPQPALWQGLQASSDGLRLAETVLFALVTLGDRSPAEVNPLVLDTVIASLRFIGFDREVRRLAVEAVVEAGL